MRQRARRFAGAFFAFIALTFAVKACADLSTAPELSIVSIDYKGPPDTNAAGLIVVSVGDTIGPPFVVRINSLDQPRARYTYSVRLIPNPPPPGGGAAATPNVLAAIKNGDSVEVKERGNAWLIATVVSATLSGDTTKIRDSVLVTARADRNFITEADGTTDIVNVPAATLLSFGETKTLKSRSEDKNGGALTGGNVAWSSSDQAVATVVGDNISATVTAVANGTAWIRAVFEGVDTDSIRIDVVQRLAKYRLTPNGQRNMFSFGDSLLVSTAGFDANNNAFVGASPPAPVFAIRPGNEDEIEFNSTTRYVKALKKNTEAGQPAMLLVRPTGSALAADQGTDTLQLSILQKAASLTIIGVGNRDTIPSLGVPRKYTVTAADANGNPLDLINDITWSIDPPTFAATITKSTTTAGEASVTALGTTGSTPIRLIASAPAAGTPNTKADTVELIITNDAASIDLTPAIDTIVALNDTISFATIRALNGNGQFLPTVPITLTSADSATVLPLPDNRLVGKATNSTGVTITARAPNGVSATALIRVTNAPDVVQIQPDTITFASVGNADGAFVVDFKNKLGVSLARNSVTWTSADASKATVSSNGLITATGSTATGETYILAVSPGNPNARDSVWVKVTNAVTTVEVTPSAAQTLTAIGATRQFTALAKNQSGGTISGAPIIWSVPAGGAFLTIDATTGLATAVANGVATVRATSGAVATNVQVTVAQAISTTTSTITPAPTSITANGTSTSVVTLQLKDANGNNIAFGGSTVTLAASAGALTPATPADSGAGRYVSVLTSGTTAATATLTATANAQAVSNNALVTFTAAPATKYLVSSTSTNPTVSTQVTISAQLADANNNPVATSGAVVTWSSTGSGFSFASPTSTTDAAGRATVTFTVTPTVGVTHTVTATTAGTGTGSLTTPISPIAAPASQYVVTAATTAPAAGAGVVVTAQLADPSGNAVLTSGQTVTWTKSDGNGSFSAATSNTNASGVATITLTTHTVAGTSTTVTATTGSLTGTSGTITTVAGASSQLTVTTAPSANPQSGIAFPTQPVLQLRDASGNVVNAANISVTVTTSGGTLGGTTTVQTNASGVATFTNLSLAGATVARTLTFSASSITSATANVTVIAGSAANMVGSGSTSGTVGQTVATAPSVTVTDASGNPVPGVSVTFTLTATGGAGGAINPASAAVIATNASGVAALTSWTLGTTAGTNNNTVTAAASGVTTVTFNASSNPGTATTITANSGLSQSATVFTNVAAPPSVTITDAGGNPVANFPVTFTLTATGGTGGAISPATPAIVNTNSSGIATLAFWTLGQTAGTNNNTVTATGSGLSTITFNASGTAGAAASIVSNSVTTQSVVVNTAATAPSVLVRDSYGNAVNAVAVTFTVMGGGGALATPASGGSINTGTNGIATVGSWTMGTASGTNTVEATVAGATLVGEPVTFTATGTPAAANNVVTNSTTSQSAIVGTSVATPPSVIVRDQFNNPVGAGISVTFTVTAAQTGGVVNGGATANVNTNASGVATLTTWTLGTTNGTNTVQVTVGNTVTFNATGTAGTPTQITTNSVTTQSAQVATAAVAPSVLIRDAGNNPVQGFSVTFTVTQTGGTGGTINSGSPAVVVTDASGIATLSSWTLGQTAGTNNNTVTATGAGLSTVTFNASGTPGAANNLIANSVTSQSATISTAVAAPPSVIVRDQFNNPVGAGIAVTFTVTAAATGGVTVPASGNTVNTSASGVATLTSWTLGTAAGSSNNTVTATISGLNTITFNASGTAGTAANIAVNGSPSTSATVGTAVATPPSVVITDGSGNPVANFSVTFTLTATGGTGGAISPVTPAAVTTNGSGIATLSSWTLGQTAGTNNNTVTATGSGLGTITFNASGTAGTATSIIVNGTPSTSGTAGATVTTPPSVLVRDAYNNPVSGVNVQFDVTAGGGSITVPTTGNEIATNASGIATIGSWTLGTTAGANTVIATVDVVTLTGEPVTFSATGVAGAAQNLIANSSTSQSATIGTAVSAPPSVVVRDVNNNPVGAGVNVTFTLTAGGGSISPASVATVATNSSGVATLTSWTLGTTAGTNNNTVTATIATLNTITFNASGTAAAAANIAVSGTPSTSATVGTAVTTPPAVLVTDGSGNPVSGFSVTFTVTATGGTGGTINSGSPAVVVTNGSGIATLTSWTLGQTAGTNNNTVTATGAGLSTITFNASGTPGAANNLIANSVTSQSAAVSTAVAAPPSVIVRDQFNNPLGAGTNVTFTLTAGGGSIVPASVATVATNASGVATLTSWTLGTVAGTNNNTVTATIATLNTITFNASGTAGTATQITVNGTPSTSATVGTAVATPPSVLIRDASNNPVAGFSVTFTLTATGGTGGAIAPVTPATVVTNSSGIATLTSWTLGQTAGTDNNTVTATGSGLGTLTFNASGTAGTANNIIVNGSPSTSGTAGSTVTTPPSVLVRDAFNNPVNGVVVTFTVTAGGGTTNPASGNTVTTGTNGVASLTSWQLGNTAGTNTVEATVAAFTLTGEPVQFNATGNAGTATNIIVTQAPTASPQSGIAFPTQPIIQLRDVNNNFVSQAGVNVEVVVVAGGTGTLGGTQTVATNASGQAVFTNLSLSGLIGANTLRFGSPTVAGTTLGTVDAPVTLTPGNPAQLFIQQQPSSNTTVGTVFAQQPIVQVRDAAGNVVTGANSTVVAAARSAGTGTLQGTTSVTSQSGIATFTNLSHNTSGSITIEFTAGGLTAATSNSITVNGGTQYVVTPVSLTAQAGQQIVVNAQLSDAVPNPVAEAGKTVGWTSTNGGSFATPSSNTNASGIASVAFTVGAAGTTHTVTALDNTALTGTSAAITVYAADGSGTNTVAPLSAAASSTGNTYTFTYTAATGGMNNGAVEITVPAGWTAPSTTASAAGYVTASTGTVGVAGQVITVTGVTLAGSGTLTIVYGATGGGGSGVTAPAATGAATFTTRQRSLVASTLTNIAAQPSVTIFAADGTGTNTVSPLTAASSSTGNTLTFTYTAAAGGMSSGAVEITIPAGWSAPSLTNSAAGYTTASTGTVGVAGQVITVTGVTLAGSATMTIIYGNTGSGGPGATASSTLGTNTFTTRQRSVATSSLTNIAAHPSVDVFAADGSGTNVVSPDPASTVASATGNELTFTYTAAAGGMNNGAVEITVPAGWSAPSLTASNAGYTTATTGTVGVAGQVITVTGVTLAASATLTIIYGDNGSGGPGATAGSTTGTNTFTTRQRSVATSNLTAIGVSPTVTVLAADGSGTNTVSPLNAAASSAGNTLTFTYTAATGGMNNGAVEITVPAGWSAPSLTGADAGYTTASTGTVGVAGQVITVTGVTLAGSATMTIVYGSTASAGPGATASATTGANTFTTRQRSASTSTLTNIAAQPVVTVFAADGTGTNTVAPLTAAASSSGNTLTFTYTAAAGGMSNGAVEITVPAGWSAPSTTGADAGYTTASTGTVGVAGQVVTVTGVTLAGSATMTIVYGSTASAGPGATATATTGASTFTTRQRSLAGAPSTLTNIAAHPVVTVYAADGSGTNTVSPLNTSASSTGNTLTFTYTAAAGGMNNGAVEITVPAGWSAPSLTGADAGFTTATTGSVGVAGQVITVTGVTLAASATMTIVYGSTASAGPGATAVATTGTSTFTTRQRSVALSALTNIAAQPSVTVYAADGSGTNTVSPNPASTVASSTGNTLTFTYTAATGGMNNGSVEITVPAGWSAPSLTGADAGFTTASTGSVGVAGQVITVTGVTLAASATMTIVYGSTASAGPGATAGSTTGTNTFTTRQRSINTAPSTLTAIGASPTVSVLAADGSGTNTVAPLTAAASSTGNTLTFTYTAAAGGMNNGAVEITVPSGWSAPSLTGADAGYTTATTGTVGVAAQVITVTGVTLAGSATMTIVYGSTASAGPGATATATTGASTFTTRQRSALTSSLTNIAAHPVVTVHAADGTGTNTVAPLTAASSSTGNTLTFTYTAATGGMSNGAVEITVPAGWSAPSLTGADAGYTTATTGTVGVAGQVITVTGVTLAGSATMTIVYGSTASAGPGATASSTLGANTFATRQRSVALSALTAIAADPSVTVYAADGSGTNTVSPLTTSASSTGNTLTFTYTAAAGGMNNGAVEVTVPAGWSAPSLTASNAGYTTASTGTVGVAGQVITVTGVTLAGSGTMTIVYGDVGGAGPGAAASATTGTNTFTTRQRSVLLSALTNIAAQPSVTVVAADGSGTNTVSPSPASTVASSTGNTLTFTYTAATGGMNNGSVEITVPTGWSAPSLTGADAGYTTASTGSVGVAGQVITVTGVTLAASATMTIVYGSTASAGPGATAGSTTGTNTFTTRQRSLSIAPSTLTAIGASPTVTVLAADGSGTNTVAPLTAAASSSGNTLTFTYTAAAGGMNNGELEISVPAGWSAPSLTGAAAGYTTASTGTVGVAGQVITVTGVTLAGSATLTVVYGSTASAGPGATATATTGASTFTTRQRSASTSTLTNIAAQPVVTVFAADGSGTNTVSPLTAAASSTGNELTFTYTAAAGGMNNGAVEITVPAGWSAPSLTASNAGFTTATTGSVGVAGQVITVTGVTLAGSATMTIVYGDNGSGGPGATAGSTLGANTFATRQRSVLLSALTAIAVDPSVTVYAADGSGTNTVSPNPASTVASATGNTLTFTYTAATGGMNNGAVEITVPAGWSAPSTTGTDAGYTTASTGTVGVAAQVITVTGVTLAGSATMTIVYGSTAGTGPGATAGSTTGTNTFTTRQRSVALSNLTAIGASPTVTVLAADGSGTNTVSPLTTSASSTGNTLTFTYTAAAGGMNNGAVEIDVPAGWSAPSITGADAGYTTASTGTVGVAGQVISVTGVTLAGSATMTIVYGSVASAGPGATASSTTGANTFTTRQRSAATSTLTAIAAQPSVTVFAADGSGTNTVSPLTAAASSAGNTLTFTYTAATGGMSNGAVEITVPAGWSAPSTTGTDAGFTTASTGLVGVAGQVITVTGVTLAGSGTFTIVYGSTAGTGPGATATATTGASTFTTRQRSLAGAPSTLTNIAVHPEVTVYAADGSGTNTVSPLTAASGSTGNELTFTYTAAAGGMNNGAVEITVPAGWSAPSLTTNAAGYTTASIGTVGVAGQVITVTGVTLAASGTLTITYGDNGSGGPGATASSTLGANTFATRQRSVALSALTAIAADPSVTVYAADGSGTNTVSPLTTVTGTSGNELTFTYTAAAGGMNNGAVEISVPAGWSAPSLTLTDAGYTTSSTGTVGVAGQIITVTGVTLAGSATMTIIYGNDGSGGPGATAGAGGTATFTTRQRSVALSSLTNIAAQPSVTVYAADGSGTNVVSPLFTAASTTGNTLTFTYTAAAGGMNDGAVEITIPTGWSAPSTTNTDNGYTTATTGTVGVAGQVITVTGVTLAGSATLTIVYGSTAGGGTGATAASTTGNLALSTRSRTTTGGVLTNIAAQPSITVHAADGSGTNTVSPLTAASGASGNTLTFTYTAATGGTNSGAVEITVPSGWSAPSTVVGNAGYTTATTGTVGVAGQVITVTGITLASSGTVTIVYGSTSGGGPGATASSTLGANAFTTRQRSLAAAPSTLTTIGASPSVTVYAPDGSGTNTVTPLTTSASSAGNELTFTYTAAAGGMNDGAVEITVPAGWSAPSLTTTAAGFTTATTGTVGVAGQVITVTGVTLAASATMTIIYGDNGSGGPGATAGSSVGANEFTTRQKSVATSSLTAIAAQPSVTLYALDGSGTNTVSPLTTVSASAGNEMTFTYTAGSGGMNNGQVEITVPAGWSAPSLTTTAAGYTTSDNGTVGVAGQVITVSGVTLAASATMTIIYGDNGSGGPGATAGAGGTATFTTRQRSTANGGSTLTAIGASPSVTVYAADGQGTAAITPTTALAGTTNNTLDLTYTATQGSLASGAQITMVVPANWSAPQTGTAGSPGYTTRSINGGGFLTNDLAITGSGPWTVTYTLQADLPNGQTIVIRYGDASAGGTATAPSNTQTGNYTFTTQMKSTSGGTLTTVSVGGGTQTVAVNNAADGSGTNTVTPVPDPVVAATSGNTLTFTYTAAAGGMNNGEVEITIPNDWSAVSTTSTDAGYTTSSSGTVTFTGQVITITGVTLAAGATLTITYGDEGGTGPGATSGAAGLTTFTTRQRSNTGGSFQNIAAHPSITVQ